MINEDNIEEEKDLVCFELNNWFAGRDYPDAEPFVSWLGNDLKLKFLNDDWVRKNKLCVSVNNIDMSVQFRIVAPRKWVEDNCPELLTKYKKFIVTENEYGDFIDRFCISFPDYENYNIGVHWYGEDDEDEINEDEED
jgi:hypothetical protein